MADPKQVDLLMQGVEAWNQYAKSGDKFDLYEVNLWGANLLRANLREGRPRGANLREASLRGTNLMGANMRHVDLRGANMERANLRGAQLFGVDLSDALLRRADCRTVVTDEGARVSTDLSEAIGLTQRAARRNGRGSRGDHTSSSHLSGALARAAGGGGGAGISRGAFRVYFLCPCQ